jgi:hypothetical protein
MRLVLAFAVVALLAAACGSTPETSTSTTAAGGSGGTSSGGGGTGDAGGSGGSGGMAEPPPTGKLPEHARTLPFAYTRPDAGTALTPAEISAATQQYLEVLQGTRWFETVAQRAHGWPETDPKKRYWYATWWSGVKVSRSGGKVTFTHSAGGADNNGLRTAQLMEGACYGLALWGTPELERLTRRLVRGSTSWFLAMERTAADDSFLMARAAYPEPVASTEMPLPLFIDYSASRPGTDGDATVYIHLPDNPEWPDLWVKNKRSKDDIGHLLRAVGEVDTCDGNFKAAEAQQELVEMRRRYEGFSRRVEADDFAIATLDKELMEQVPPDGLAHFIKFLECGSLLSLQLTGHGHPTDVDCGDGNDPVPEGQGGIKSGAMQIVRSFHTAAVQQALVHGQVDIAKTMLSGIGKRLDTVMDLIDAGTPPDNFSTKDLAAFMVHAASAGVPLTSREARWLHLRITEAHAAYLDASQLKEYDLFSPGAPDGDYDYEPGGEGIDFKDLGLVLGLCAAQYKNPATREVLDCDAVKAFSP